MTTVIWTGDDLIADRHRNYYGLAVNQKKLQFYIAADEKKFVGIAGAGDVADINAISQWYLNGAIPDLYPHDQIRDRDSAILVLTIHVELSPVNLPKAIPSPFGGTHLPINFKGFKKSCLFFDSPHPVDVTATPMAIGSGAKTAMGIINYAGLIGGGIDYTSLMLAVARVDVNTSPDANTLQSDITHALGSDVELRKKFYKATPAPKKTSVTKKPAKRVTKTKS